jgi:hypothetical protein
LYNRSFLECHIYDLIAFVELRFERNSWFKLRYGFSFVWVVKALACVPKAHTASLAKALDTRCKAFSQANSLHPLGVSSKSGSASSQNVPPVVNLKDAAYSLTQKPVAPSVGVVYRSLRIGETLSLRCPTLRLLDLSAAELREVIVGSVANGNQSGFPNQFISCSTDRVKVWNIALERSHLYNGHCVRIDLKQMNQTHIIDLSTTEAQRSWLCEVPADSEDFLEEVRKCRTYSAKDKEVLLLVQPPKNAIQLIDRETGIDVRVHAAGNVLV